MSTDRVTIVFPLYQSVVQVPSLISSLKSQQGWQDFQVLFIDNCSKDGTVEKLREEIEKLGNPQSIRIVVNEKNLGLSGSLNKAFSLCQTPFVLTCHSDCVFEKSDYVLSMVRLMESDPSLGAITGHPRLRPLDQVTLAEKINLVANLMDVFAPEELNELVPVGFAEGRCDIFRREALQKVGFYDTTLRRAGEDQILASDLRHAGYQVCKASWLEYTLGLSSSQDSLYKLISHQRCFGRAHPYIMLHSKQARKGVVSRRAGWNRMSRAGLRFSQLFSVLVYLWAFYALISGVDGRAIAWVLLGLWAMKQLLFWRHLAYVRFGALENLVFWALQPVLDFSYTTGLIQGSLCLCRPPERRQIR